MKTNITPAQLFALPLQQRFKLFVQWLGNQPENGRYHFADCASCAMARFARSLDGVNRNTFISAGPYTVDIDDIGIELIPEFKGANRYALLSNVFGQAYHSFAASAGLPHRAHSRAVTARIIARFIRHKHALAA